jgi:hypothetical protein
MRGTVNKTWVKVNAARPTYVAALTIYEPPIVNRLGQPTTAQRCMLQMTLLPYMGPWVQQNPGFYLTLSRLQSQLSNAAS